MPETETPTGERATTTLLVALGVSLVCSSLVASAAVVLKPRQEANRLREVQRNILEVSGLEGTVRLDEEGLERVEVRVIDLQEGTYVEVDPTGFDPAEAAKDPETSVAVPPEIDRARIGRRAKWGVVYLVRSESDELERIILPVSGQGLWSTMYGFIALEMDGNTIAAVTFYEHGETPGLGDQIADPSWRSQWEGKQVFDQEGRVRFEVAKGAVSDSDPLSTHRVDGISGATLTGNGVTHLIRYWLGDHGYGPYLDSFQGKGTP
ncbi:MAG: Na(+)-translocating NADH-quinone reductase subunit C [Myxococcota bacterium]